MRTCEDGTRSGVWSYLRWAPRSGGGSDWWCADAYCVPFSASTTSASENAKRHFRSSQCVEWRVAGSRGWYARSRYARAHSTLGEVYRYGTQFILRRLYLTIELTMGKRKADQEASPDNSKRYVPLVARPTAFQSDHVLSVLDGTMKANTATRRRRTANGCRMATVVAAIPGEGTVLWYVLCAR